MRIVFLAVLMFSTFAFADYCPSTLVIKDLEIKKYKLSENPVNITQLITVDNINGVANADFSRIVEDDDRCLYVNHEEGTKIILTFNGYNWLNVKISRNFYRHLDGWGHEMKNSELFGSFSNVAIGPGSKLDLTSFRLSVKYSTVQWWDTDFINFNRPSKGYIEFGEDL